MRSPQRSCLGNKTEAVRIVVVHQRWLVGPQRSCLGNKTEAVVGVVVPPSGGFASTKLPR